MIESQDMLENEKPIKSQWYNYAEKTEGRPPRQLALLQRALVLTKEKNHALDIGAGALNDSLYLLEQGFKHVTALDKEPVATKRAQEISTQNPDRFEYAVMGAEDFHFAPNTYNFVHASYSLPFVPATSIPTVMDRIIASLKPEGIFEGQFFGERDAWKGVSNVTTHTEHQVRAFFQDVEIVYFNSEEGDKIDSEGMTKHWHVYHIIVRK